jgi:hypothetical protein
MFACPTCTGTDPRARTVFRKPTPQRCTKIISDSGMFAGQRCGALICSSCGQCQASASHTRQSMEVPA